MTQYNSEIMTHYLCGMPGFGKKNYCTITSNAPFCNNIILKIVLSPLQRDYEYISDIDKHILENINLNIGGITVKSMNNDYLIAIKNKSYVFDNVICIVLPFDLDVMTTFGLPLVSLSSHEVRVNFTFADIHGLIKSKNRSHIPYNTINKNFDCNLLINSIFIDDLKDTNLIYKINGMYIDTVQRYIRPNRLFERRDSFVEANIRLSGKFCKNIRGHIFSFLDYSDFEERMTINVELGGRSYENAMMCNGVYITITDETQDSDLIRRIKYIPLLDHAIVCNSHQNVAEYSKYDMLKITKLMNNIDLEENVYYIPFANPKDYAGMKFNDCMIIKLQIRMKRPQRGAYILNVHRIMKNEFIILNGMIRPVICSATKS
jgi:hypothetical protein